MATLVSVIGWLRDTVAGLDLWSRSVLGGVSAFLLLAFAIFVWRRSRRERRDRLTLEEAIRDDVHLPQSLHPVIDPDVCIGSLSCITACPEGDILGVVDGVAKLIVGSNCIGHGRCATECPVHAIRLVVGTSERGVDLPEVDSQFESSRPGVHIVGELGGMGLIKNAIRQGLQVAAHLGQVLASASMRSRGDVLIVGAGPAGLAAALGCRAVGLSFRIVDQGRFGGTIANYPRQKVVMTERVQLPIWGKFGKPLISKEELLETWGKIARKAKIAVEEGVRVERIEGADQAFRVVTSKGVIPARKIVLAIGRRGTPRKLGVPGEALPKVTYQLDDPEQYRGRRVLVVGGGDSAIEAACQLAELPDVEVAISYRQKAFAKCRQANRERITGMIERGEVHAFLGSTVAQVDRDAVVLQMPDGKKGRLPNDFVIACLGGELPSGFLKQSEIGLVRHRGDKALAHVVGTKAQPGAGTRRRDYLPLALFIVGASVLAALTAAGLDYYLLDRAERMRSPMHPMFRSSGVWGHGVGIVATLFMLSNFLYPLRKRLGFMKGSAPIKSWLTFHIFVGIMSPLVIAFHAAFQSRNQLATSTYVSLLVVVLTGLIGRFVYGLVPTEHGKAKELAFVRDQLGYEQSKLRVLLESSRAAGRLRALFDAAATAPEKRGSLIVHFLGAPLRWLGDRVALLRVRGLFDEREAYLTFKYAYLDVRTLHTQVSFYSKLKRLLSAWRGFHVVLSIFLVVIISFHVGFSLYLGYRWLF